MSSFICELILDTYGFYQNTTDIIDMKNKRFKKSTTYKFLILSGIFNIFNHLLNIFIVTWLLIDLNEDSCYYFAAGLIFTEFSRMGLLFGISVLRLISVLKRKFFITYEYCTEYLFSLDQLEDVLWKSSLPIFVAIALTLMFTIFKRAVGATQQVGKMEICNWQKCYSMCIMCSK